LVGSINYPAVITRPDVAKAASLLSEHLHNPSPAHQDTAEYYIAYLFKTRHLAIQFNGAIARDQDVFIALLDAAFGDDLNTRHSSDGYLIQMYSRPIN
jgi:hypothetical protein